MSASDTSCAEPCGRPCTITLHSPSGAILYQEAPSLLEESTIDWIHIMARIIRERHPHEPTQVHLVADDDRHTCFAVGNSFASLYWVDNFWWGELIAARWCSGYTPLPGQSTDAITITVIFNSVLNIGDCLRHSESGYWTITGIQDGSRGHDLTMMHNRLQWESSFDSQQIWYWHTLDTVPLNIKLCKGLTKHMPQTRTTECDGCAQLLMALGGPARRPARHGIRFPAHSSECTCEQQRHCLLIVASRDHSYWCAADHDEPGTHSPDLYLELPDSPAQDLP